VHVLTAPRVCFFPGGQRVGESQFLETSSGDARAAEFVREGDGEASVHFEMHDSGVEDAAGAGGGGAGTSASYRF
jgi:hypothetical protein